MAESDPLVPEGPQNRRDLWIVIATFAGIVILCLVTYLYFWSTGGLYGLVYARSW